VVSAGFFFALMSALIRLVSEDMHPFGIVFFRNFFGLVFMLPWLWRGGFRQLHTRRLGLYLLRAVVGVLSMLGFFWGLTVMTLADAVSLSFSAPLFVTIGAALILGETVRMRRWSATVVGFLGVLIILRPGIEEPSIPALVVMCSAVGMAVSILMIKTLARTESSNAIVTYMVLTMTPLSLLPALTVWTWPQMETLGWLLLLGGAGTAGHLLFTNALRVADASLVMPFDFARLPFTAVFGYLMFGQIVDIWTWVGGAVIFTAGAYIAQRESQVNVATIAEPEL
jgi:drug/metabolite transporter (DMT)-like permease